MTRAACILLLAALAWPTFGGMALAHGGGHEEGFGWSFDPVLMLPLFVSGALVGAGLLRLRWRTSRTAQRRRWRSAAFAAGWTILLLAVASPLHAWGEHLFSAHMVEHEAIMAVAAPLLVLSRPWGPALWALPSAARRAVAGALRLPGWRAAWRWCTHPAVATAQHAVVLWVWHAPAFFEASLASEGLHRLQHVSFLASAILFWWSVLRRASLGEAFAHVTLTMLHMSVLGALIALAPRVIYHAQTAGAPLAGLTPLADQQIAGLVMWVPAGGLYAAVALAFAAAWIRNAGRRWRTDRGFA